MDFEKLIINAESLQEAVGIIAMDESVNHVSATVFAVPFRYVRVYVEYVDDDLHHVDKMLDIEPNRRANWGNDEPMFIISNCE